MKFAAYAALIAAVAAEQSCHENEVSWTIYKDSKCKTVDKKMQKKFGHVKKDDLYLWSGDCEVYKAPDGKYGTKTTCDADGLHQSAWTSTKCKGDAEMTLNYSWGKCTLLQGAE